MDQQSSCTQYCPHCGERVSRATYFRHKARFYDRFRNTWQTCADGVTCTTEALLNGDTPLVDSHGIRERKYNKYMYEELCASRHGRRNGNGIYNAPINVMPHYHRYGLRVGDGRG